MRLAAALLIQLCLVASAIAQCGTVNLVVRATDIGIQPTVGTLYTLTPTGNLRRTCGTNLIGTWQRSVRSDGNGVAIFTNTIWGAYDLDVPTSNGTTEWKLWVTTNYTGNQSAALYVTNSSAMPPNPTASYYTSGQTDALLSNVIATGGPTNGIPQLNGTGTGTVLINPTVSGGNVATTNMIEASLTGVVTQHQTGTFSLGGLSGTNSDSQIAVQLGALNIVDAAGNPANLYAGSIDLGDGLIYADGSQLLYLPADQLSSGTVPLARLANVNITNFDSVTRALIAAGGNTNGSVTVAGSGLSSVVSNGVTIMSLYVAPTISNFINNQNTVEIGSTVSSTVLGTWALGGGTITSQSLNQGIGTISTALRTYTDTNSYSIGRTYTLTVTDGTTTNSASTAVAFEHKSYWGTSANSAYTTLASLANSGFATVATKSGMSFSPANEYMYYAHPLAFGSVSFNVGGFNVNDWTAITNHFTNQSGNTSDYLVWRSSAPIYGTGIIVNAY
jgi:hypothetical protein